MMGVQLTTPVIEKKSRCKSYTPATPRAATHRSISEKTMGVGLTPLDIDREKLTLQILYPRYPPRRHASFHLREDEGGGVNSDDCCRKNIAAGPIPPLGRRGNGTPAKGRWGCPVPCSQSPERRPDRPWTGASTCPLLVP